MVIFVCGYAFFIDDCVFVVCACIFNSSTADHLLFVREKPMGWWSYNLLTHRSVHALEYTLYVELVVRLEVFSRVVEKGRLIVMMLVVILCGDPAHSRVN